MIFDYDDLVGQFILCRNENDIPAPWTMRRHGSWYLGVHVALPVVEILASDSAMIGWLLGYPIHPEGLLVTETVRFSFSSKVSQVSAQFESSLYAYGGRFAAVCFATQTPRLYLDPCGTLAAVFSPKQQMVASTTTLIPRLDDQDDNHELIRALDIPGKDAYYPFGLTSRRSVARLLPNHFLDLETWQAVRHWPSQEFTPVDKLPDAVNEMAHLLKNNITAVVRKHPLYMSLTAGRDSRMLLACARPHLHDISFVTFGVPQSWGLLDKQVAPRIAKRLHLKHSFLPYEQPSENELNEWLNRTGYCIRGSQWVRTYNRLDPQRAVLMGAAGELGRGFHWRKGDTESSPICADDLLLKRDLPITTEIKSRARQWLENLPVKNTLTIWGLLYNELFNGCWFGPLLYGFKYNPLYIWPFSQRRIIEIMMSLPADYRRNNILPVELIKSHWPELLRIPFNWPIGIKRYFYAVKWRTDLIRRKWFSKINNKKTLPNASPGKG